MKTLVAIIIIAFLSSPVYSQYSWNIVDNPGAESDYTNWNVVNGGSGWAISATTGIAGSKCWVSSYINCSLSQTIDLIAKGIAPATLDASPSISAGVYVLPGLDGYYDGIPSKGTITILIELLNASNTVVSSTYLANAFLIPIGTAMTWDYKSAIISGYPTGVRKIKVTLTGKDGRYWSGQYGPSFDNVSIQLNGTLPVELTHFTASAEKNGITLNWNTATETNNYGFEVEKNSHTEQPRATPLGGAEGASKGEWIKIGFVEGNGTTNAPKLYSFTDKSASGTTSYRLKQIDRDGKFEYSQTVEVTAAAALKEFALEQNYPNPFNPSTTIQYSIPAGADGNSSAHVTLTVFDAVGKEVATLVDEVKEAGTYSTHFDGSMLSSGIYFVRLSSGRKMQIRKLLLMQ
jgi:hypothetical protein